MDVATILDIFEAHGFDPDDEVITVERKLEAINDTYYDACQRESWPFLEVWLGSDPIVGGVVNVQDFDIRTVISIWDSINNRVLQPIRMDDLQQEQLARNPQRWAAGIPQVYYWLGRTIYVYPQPEDLDGLVLNVSFIQDPRPLTETSVEADILIPKRHHRGVLVNGSLSRLALMQDDVDLANGYERLYEKALTLMVDAEFRRQSDRPEYIHVQDYDNYDYS